MRFCVGLRMSSMVLMPLILAACAGGKNVDAPSAALDVPKLGSITLPIASSDRLVDDSKMLNFNVGQAGNGKVVAYAFRPYSFSSTDSYRMFYQAPNGKTYALSSYTNPLLPDSFSLNKTLDTKHKMQPTDDNGKLFVCCTSIDGTHQSGGSIYYSATQTPHLRYGVWMNPTEQADLFVGGILADVKKLPGANESNNYTATGKATFELWALRSNNGGVASSTYKPHSTLLIRDGEKSLMTVNFNTGQLVGQIVGDGSVVNKHKSSWDDASNSLVQENWQSVISNKDFGAGIEFTGQVEGNRFSGNAVSGGVSGKLEGAFYGDENIRSRDLQVGGKFTFDGNNKLDAVFGGKAIHVNTSDTSNSLQHVD